MLTTVNIGKMEKSSVTQERRDFNISKTLSKINPL